MKNVTNSVVYLGHWSSAGSFGFNTDILATNPINLSTTRKLLIINSRFRCFYTFSVRNVIKIDGIFRWKVVDYKAVDFNKSVDVNIIYNGYFC